MNWINIKKRNGKHIGNINQCEIKYLPEIEEYGFIYKNNLICMLKGWCEGNGANKPLNEYNFILED